MSPTQLASGRTALIALCVVAGGVAVGAVFDVTVAALLLAGVALVGAATRLALRAGQSFSVRRRYVDVALLVAFAVALTFLALTTPLG